MHWILCANGPCQMTPRLRNLLLQADYLVSVDGGSRHLHSLGLRPDLAVGDMDSIAPETLATYKHTGVKLHLHPVRKDASDLELALDLALAGQATRLTFLGVIGERLDHTISNLFLLARCLEHGLPACATDAGQSIYMTSSVLDLSGHVGDLLSLIPLTAQVHGVTLRGLDYPLLEGSLDFASTKGISNIFAASTVQVRVGLGRLLVLHSYKE